MTFKEFKKRLKDIFLGPPPKISWEFPKVAFEDLKRIFIEVLGNKRGELGVPKDKLEVLAEYYSVELAEKTLRGMTENALACKVNGSIPLGFMPTEDGHFQIDPVYAPIIVEIYEMY